MPPIHSSTTSHLYCILLKIFCTEQILPICLGYPELKIFRTNQFDKPKYQRTQVSVYIDESQSIQNWNELWMKKGGGVLDPGWHTLYEPRVLSPACPRCTIYALYVAYWAYWRSSSRLWHAPVILSQDVVGRVRWDDGRVLTMPYLSPYTATAPILSGETKPLWTRPSGHGGHAQMCLCLPIDPPQISSYGTFWSPQDWGVKRE